MCHFPINSQAVSSRCNTQQWWMNACIYFHRLVSRMALDSLLRMPRCHCRLQTQGSPIHISLIRSSASCSPSLHSIALIPCLFVLASSTAAGVLLPVTAQQALPAIPLSPAYKNTTYCAIRRPCAIYIGAPLLPPCASTLELPRYSSIQNELFKPHFSSSIL